MAAIGSPVHPDKAAGGNLRPAAAGSNRLGAAVAGAAAGWGLYSKPAGAEAEARC